MVALCVREVVVCWFSLKWRTSIPR